MAKLKPAKQIDIYGYLESLDPNLTPAGCLMAEDLAESYSILPWSAIHSSPLPRAVDTAGPLCDRTGLKIQLNDGLNGIAFGLWEGKNPEEVDREFHDNLDPDAIRVKLYLAGIDGSARLRTFCCFCETINSGGIMNKAIVFFAICTTLVISVHAQDPVVTDGDKYKAILENEKVRVLEYTDEPGEKTTRHHHPDFVLYALDSFKRKLTFGDGKQIEREFKKGDVMWMKDQIHIGENIGTTETHVLIVELKSKGNDTQDTGKAVPYDNKWKEESEKKPKGKKMH